MRRLTQALALLAAAMSLLEAPPARAYIVGSRWNYTATNGSAVGSQGTPITLTWSFAADGTIIPSGVSSNLISFLDTNLGAGPGGTDYTQRPWFGRFQQSFDRMTALSGVTYLYEPNDDGRSFANTTSARGSLGVRGDIRIGGKSYGEGSNTLASNYYPSYGEMMLNTDKASFFSGTSNNNRGFRNVVMHEAMHGLGIRHVESSSGFLIEPNISTSFDGPQLDDLLAIQRLYGDFREKNGGNDTFNLATSLGLVTPTQSRQLGTLGSSTVISSTQTDFLSIDDDSDTDFFSFTTDARLDVSLLLAPRGTSYMVGPQDGEQSLLNTLTLSDLTLALFDTNGTSLLDLANSNPAGVAESITRQLMPGTYYARVTGAQNDIQLYGLAVSAAAPQPADLLWVGNLSNAWDTALTANFQQAGSAAAFNDFDDVRFDDTTSSTAVNLADDVSPGKVQISTDSGYTFTGSGGIVSGRVDIDGTGTVVFANSGNSYSGLTQILSGTLAITGDANAMQSLMLVSGGATLQMDPTDAATMASNFSIAAGGVLQIGTLGSTGNVFPDHPASVINDGTVRVLDEETLESISGSGNILVESETTTLLANPSFAGEVVVKSGATARVLDSAGLGEAAAQAIVEAGGLLVIDSSATVSGGLTVSGEGFGNGAVEVTSGNNAALLGEVSLVGNVVKLYANSDATISFAGVVSGVPDQTRLVVQSELGANVRLQGGVSLAGGGVTKRGDGTGELGGLLDYTGDTLVEAGTLRLTGSGVLVGALEVEEAAELELGGTHEFSTIVRLSGNGQIRGDLVMPGTISPGNSAGSITLIDNVMLEETSVVDIELGGTEQAVNYDLLQVLGQATLGGTLQVSLIEDFVPQIGNLFEVLTANGGIVGLFSAATLPTLEEGLSWNLLYDSTSVRLEVQAAVTLLPGDYNGDGMVNAADYTMWRDTLGSKADVGGGLEADGDHSNIVDEADYFVWSENFGGSTGGGAIATVPEPSAFSLVGLTTLAGIFILRNRRTRGLLKRSQV